MSATTEDNSRMPFWVILLISAIVGYALFVMITTNPDPWPKVRIWADRPIPSGARLLVPTWALNHTLDELRDAGMDWVGAYRAGETPEDVCKHPDDFWVWWYREDTNAMYLTHFQNDRATCISGPYPFDPFRKR